MDCEGGRNPLAPGLAMAPSPQSRFAAVIVAAGQGSRAERPVPKQVALGRGKPLVRHSAETLIASGAAPVIVAIPQGAEDVAKEVLAGLSGVRFVTGGATRQASVPITRGENSGKTLTYYNVVREITPVGMWTGKSMSVQFERASIARPDTNRCAVLLQEGQGGPIIGAAMLDRF